MYIVLYSKEIFNENEEHIEAPIMRAYFCNKKQLAIKYAEKRMNSLMNTLKKTPDIVVDQVDNFETYKCIEYSNTKCEYPYTVKKFIVMKCKEIEDLPYPCLK